MSTDELFVLNFFKMIGGMFLIIFVIFIIIVGKIQKNQEKVYYRDREYNALKDIKQILNKNMQEKELRKTKH